MDNFDNNDFNNYERQPNHEMNSRHGRNRSPYDRNRRRSNDTEFAADFVANEMGGDATNVALITGVVGVIAAVVALFTYPVMLGIVGIALGCYAVAKGNKIVGFLAIGIGLLAAAMPLIFDGSFISIF